MSSPSDETPWAMVVRMRAELTGERLKGIADITPSSGSLFESQDVKAAARS